MREREREKESEEQKERDFRSRHRWHHGRDSRSHSTRHHQRSRQGHWSWRSRGTRGHSDGEFRNRHRSYRRSRSCAYEKRRRETLRRRWTACPPLKTGSIPVVSSRRTTLRYLASSQEEKDSAGKRSNDEDHECSLFIDNLRRDTDTRALRWLLRMDKHIRRIFISRKRRPNNKRSFAFVKMSSPSHVQQAVTKVHRRFLLGHRIFARQAKYEAKVSSVGAGIPSQQRTPVEKELTHTALPVTESSAPDAGVCEDAGGYALGGSGAVQQDGSEGEAGGACLEGRDVLSQLRLPVGNTTTITNPLVAVSSSPVAEMRKDGDASGGRVLPQEGNDGGAGGAWLKRRDTQMVALGNRDSQAGPNSKDYCCCRPRYCTTEQPFQAACADHACIKEDKVSGAFDSGGFVFWYGLPVCYWSYVPSPSQSCLPGVGYWPSQSIHGNDLYGYYNQLQGWGSWPYNHGAGGYLGGREQSATVTHAQNTQETMGSGGRAPIIIRPPRGNISGPDPVMEDIINKDRGGVENSFQWIDKLGNGDNMGANIEQYGGAMVEGFSKPGSEPIRPQAQLLEDDLDDIGLRSLFEDPEFPPGFEPARGPFIRGDDPEDAAVKEEARQTLIFAKRLGCSIPNEKLTLSNYEELIRKQKASIHRSCHIESEESIEESDRCSRSISKDKSKRIRGARSVGFSKFSRASKMATRGKKKAK